MTGLGQAVGGDRSSEPGADDDGIEMLCCWGHATSVFDDVGKLYPMPVRVATAVRAVFWARFQARLRAAGAAAGAGAGAVRSASAPGQNATRAR